MKKIRNWAFKLGTDEKAYCGLSFGAATRTTTSISQNEALGNKGKIDLY